MNGRFFLTPLTSFKWFFVSIWKQCRSAFRILGIRISRLSYYERLTGTSRPREQWETSHLSQFLDYVWSRQDYEAYQRVVRCISEYLESRVTLGVAVKSILIIMEGDMHAIDALRRALPEGHTVQITKSDTNVHYIRATCSPNETELQVALVPFSTEAGPRWADMRMREFLDAAAHQADIEALLLSLEDAEAQQALDCGQQELDKIRSTTLDVNAAARRRKLVQLMDRFSRARNMFPQKFFVSGLNGMERLLECRGTYFALYQATHNGDQVAVKVLRRTVEDTKNLLKRRMVFWHDAFVWRQLWHPNIMHIEGVDKERFDEDIALVLPWTPNSNINRYITSSRPRPQVSIVNQWIEEIVSGLHYLHSEAIIHGAIRGHNVMIGPDGHVRLTDYGVAVNPEMEDISNIDQGFAWWSAPELMEPEEYGLPNEPTYASDVFAFAFCCIEIFGRKQPFSGMVSTTRRRLVLGGGRPERPTGPNGYHMNDMLWTMVQKCWSQNPAERPDSSEILCMIQRG